MGDQKVIYDISPEISEDTAVFPGDSTYRRKIVMDFAYGANFTLSNIQTTVHIGAHTDAPIHYHRKGTGIDERDLNFYYGDCQVIAVQLAAGQRILPKHLENTSLRSKRILFKTNSFPNPNHWNSNFNALSPEVIDDLAARGVVLVGIDTPSIDLAEDKELRTHQAVFRNDMAVLEGIVLDKVPEGFYTLIALPLKLKGADASPVRAVLVK